MPKGMKWVKSVVYRSIWHHSVEGHLLDQSRLLSFLLCIRQQPLQECLLWVNSIVHRAMRSHKHSMSRFEQNTDTSPQKCIKWWQSTVEKFCVKGHFFRPEQREQSLLKCMKYQNSVHHNKRCHIIGPSLDQNRENNTKHRTSMNTICPKFL